MEKNSIRRKQIGSLRPRGSYWGPIGVLLGSYWGPIGVLLRVSLLSGLRITTTSTRLPTSIRCRTNPSPMDQKESVTFFLRYFELLRETRSDPGTETSCMRRIRRLPGGLQSNHSGSVHDRSSG